MCFLNGGCFTLQKRQLFWRHGHSFLRLRRACSITIYLFSRVFSLFLLFLLILLHRTWKNLWKSFLFCNDPAKILQHPAKFLYRYFIILQDFSKCNILSKACSITIHFFSRVFSLSLLFLLILLHSKWKNLLKSFLFCNDPVYILREPAKSF